MSCLKFFRPLVVVFLVFLVSPASAQNERDRDSWTASSNLVEVSGQVRFADGMQPATNVSVRLERFGAGSMSEQMLTDSRGKFRFANLPRGQYLVTVSAPCLTSAQQQAELQVVFRSYMVFELKPERSSPACRSEASAGVIDVSVPTEARREFERGRAALLEKKSGEGLTHLKKAVSLHADFFAAQLLLGTTYMEAQEWARAAEHLRHALKLNPESLIALLSLGEVERRQKHYDEAEKALQAGLKQDENSWQGHFTLGRVYWEKGEVAKAAPHVGRTLQLKPDFAEAHLLGANILLRVGQPERALSEYEEYLRLSPSGEFAAPTRELVQKIKRTLADKKD
jgi:tetratricopeptide (TPR) repeat protein